MPGNIREWLAALELEHLTPMFEEGQVGFRDLPLLDDADLRELGLPLGPRKRVLSAITALKSNEAGFESQNQESNDHALLGVERRQLTVMFCDLVGSTELSRRLDPEDLRDVMRSYQDVVTATVVRYGGHVAKYLGDGLLVYFGWPQAYEDQAERGVRAGFDAVAAVAGLEVDDEGRLQARVGIATGQVVIGDLVGRTSREAEAVSGETPNLAARLQQVAAPGQVVIGAVTRDLIGPSFELDELGAHDLKGFAEPVPAWRVVAVQVAEARFETRARGLTPFIGREHELGLLIDRWQQARDGEGQVVLLSGEAGIGKSRLLRALSDQVDREPRTTLRYQCSSYNVDNALHPFVQHYLRAARIDPSDQDETKLDKLEALLASSGFDVSAAAPLFASLLSLPSEARYGTSTLTPAERKEQTLELLITHLTALAEREPVLMLFEDAHWIDPTTQELLEETSSLIVERPVMVVIAHRPEWQASFHGAPHVTPLVVNRLRRARSDELVRAAGGGKLADSVIHQIVSRTDGIPLFVEELTKSVLEASDVESKSEIPETLQASLLARLDRLGPAKHVAQVGAVIGRDFDHNLLESLIGDGEPELQSLIGHLVASELIYQQGHPPNVSYVFKHALVQEAAYESLLRSRRRELHGDIARALLAQTPEQAALLAYHWERAEDLDQAFTCRVKAAEQASNLHARWEAISERWSALNLLDRMPQTQETGFHRIDLLLLMIGTGSIFWRSEAERSMARRHLDKAIEEASKRGRWAAVAILKAYKGDYWEDESLLFEAVENAAESGDKSAQAVVAERCAGYFGKHGLFARAHEHIEHAVQIYGDLDEQLSQGAMLAGVGRCYYARAGRLDDAFRCARQAREIAGKIKDPRLSAWIPMEAEVFFYKGLWKEVVEVVEDLIGPAWDTGTWDAILWTYAWAAIAYLKLDRQDDAARLIDRSMTELVPKVVYEFPKIYPLIALGQLQLATADASLAVESGRQALALAERSANRLEQGAAHRALAQAYEQTDDEAAASAQFQESLAILNEIQSPPELAQSLLAYGRFLLKTNPEDGREQLERALALFEDLGATGWIEETRAALAPA